MSFPPPAPIPAAKSNANRYIIIGLIVFALIAFSLIKDRNKDDGDESPGTGTELCALMADPEHDILTADDLADLADFNRSQLESYVQRNCPELAYRVD